MFHNLTLSNFLIICWLCKYFSQGLQHNSKKKVPFRFFFPHQYFSENSFPYTVSTALPQEKQSQIRPWPANSSSRGWGCLSQHQAGTALHSSAHSPHSPGARKTIKKMKSHFTIPSSWGVFDQKSFYNRVTREGSTRFRHINDTDSGTWIARTK